jgi:hypothetical protein
LKTAAGVAYTYDGFGRRTADGGRRAGPEKTFLVFHVHPNGPEGSQRLSTNEINGLPRKNGTRGDIGIVDEFRLMITSANNWGMYKYDGAKENPQGEIWPKREWLEQCK